MLNQDQPLNNEPTLTPNQSSIQTHTHNNISSLQTDSEFVIPRKGDVGCWT